MLSITSQPAILAWDSKKAQLDQEGNGALTLDIQMQKPQLSHQTRNPKITIDQTEPFAEAGLKGIRAFMDDSVSFAKQKWSEGVNRIVSDGNQWIDIHTGADPIPDQAEYNAFGMFEKEFNFAMIPTSRPKIDVQRGEVNFDYNPGKVVNNTQVEKIKMNYSPWQINRYMKQYHSVQINFEPSNFSKSV